MVAPESQAVFLKRFFEFNFNSLQKIHGTKIHGTKIHGTKIHGTIKEWNTWSIFTKMTHQFFTHTI